MILPVAYGVFVNTVLCSVPKGYICQWTQCGAAATARRVRVLNTAGHARRKRCYRHLVCCMTGLGYNPHTFSIIHNQPKAPLEDEGREELFMKHLFTMLLTLVAVTASAQDFEVDGIYYNILSEDERTVEVTGSPYGYSGDVVIPADVTYDGSTYSVTTIGDMAFHICSDLTSISMPSVTTIGDNAFKLCSDLTSVEMPSVTTIGDYAFYYCSALTSVEMPAVTTIGNHAFNWCSTLTSVDIPSVTTIGDYAFYYCSALTSVEMPAVTTIGEYAFSSCHEVTSVSMPSVTTIGDNAFSGCFSLASVFIPASCTLIGANPFEQCIELKEIVVEESNPNYSSADGILYDKGKTTLIGWPAAESDIDIMPSVTTIGSRAFSSLYALTSVSMPEVTTIGDQAFSYCDALTSVSMPSVTTIGDAAFGFCHTLKSVDMPSVETLSNYAFRDCQALTSVDIPASCTSIGANPFVGCTNLKEIMVDENNPNYSSADGALYDNGKTTLIGWPTAEGDIDIMPSVTTIGDGALYSCYALTSVYMPSVTTIGDAAFGFCHTLKSVDMPSVAMIGDVVFSGYSVLTSVDIPASVTTIGDRVFSACSGLTSVYCHWEQPLECDPSFAVEALDNATLYVPTGTIDAYRSVSPWREFINIEERDYSGIADTPGSAVGQGD